MPFSLSSRDDQSYSYLSSLEKLVNSSLLPTWILYCLDTHHVEVKDNVVSIDVGTAAFNWILLLGVNPLVDIFVTKGCCPCTDFSFSNFLFSGSCDPCHD